MTEKSAKIDGRDVLGSGCLVIAAGHTATVPVLASIEVTFRFSEDSTGKHAVRGTVRGTNLDLELLNINNSLGVSFENRIGSSQGRYVEMALFIHATGVGDEAVRLLHYTFWAGEEVVDGQA